MPVAKTPLGWKRIAGLLIITTVVAPLIGGLLVGLLGGGIFLLAALFAGGPGISFATWIMVISPFVSLWLGAVPGLIIGLAAIWWRPDSAGETMGLTALVLMPFAALLSLFAGPFAMIAYVAAIPAAGITFAVSRRFGFSLR